MQNMSATKLNLCEGIALLFRIFCSMEKHDPHVADGTDISHSWHRLADEAGFNSWRISVVASKSQRLSESDDHCARLLCRRVA